MSKGLKASLKPKEVITKTFTKEKPVRLTRVVC